MRKRKANGEFSRWEKALWARAVSARSHAYSPYFKYKVGSALLCASGEIIEGCNVENCAGTSICAERTAFVKAVSQGERRFQAIAIVTQTPSAAGPCGFCLQTMAEFCDPKFLVLLGTPKSLMRRHTFEELLPHAFTPEKLT